MLRPRGQQSPGVGDRYQGDQQRVQPGGDGIEQGFRAESRQQFEEPDAQRQRYAKQPQQGGAETAETGSPGAPAPSGAGRGRGGIRIGETAVGGRQIEPLALHALRADFRFAGGRGMGLDERLPIAEHLVGIGPRRQQGVAAVLAMAAEKIEGGGIPGDHGALRFLAIWFWRFINSKWSFIKARTWRPRGVRP